jgi:N-acetylmuramoyl-L-alanine amidase
MSKTLIIDPGHGGDDPCVEVAGIREAGYVLRFARELACTMTLERPDVRTILTRSADVDIPLAQRREFIDHAGGDGGDLVLALHCNASADQSQRGGLALYWPGNTTGGEVASTIARALPPPLHRSWARGWPATWGHWPRARQVCGAYRPTTVVVELGYLDHPEDRTALLDPNVQMGLRAALLAGVARWLALSSR